MATIIEKTAITFSDVLLVPQYSEVLSRTHVNTTSDMGKFKLRIPVISANMRDITGSKMCIELARLGCMGILHRFMSIDENILLVKNIINEIYNMAYVENLELNSEDISTCYGVSVGVKEEEKDRFIQLYDVGARIFCVDVAHGDHINVKKMVEFMKKEKGDTICIIAGNIATGVAAKRLIDWGVDVIKCGVGPGQVCQTRNMAATGVPQLSAIMEVKDVVESSGKNVKIISDGGIKNPGDIAKALVYSDAVMVGSMFSGTSETPGMVFNNEKGQFYKTYGGSASGENKVKSNMENKFVEGMVKSVEFKGHVKYIVGSIHDGLRSAFSYSGVNNLSDFQEVALLQKISGGGKTESKF